jgi:hypothetical protein
VEIGGGSVLIRVCMYIEGCVTYKDKLQRATGGKKTLKSHPPAS